MSFEKVGFGIIGTGAVAAAHAMAITNSEYAKLVAVYDVVPERAKEFAAKYNAVAVEDFEAFLALSELESIYEDKLESVYPCRENGGQKLETFSYETKERVAPRIYCPKPKVLIPVFPGTNCEFDTAKVLEDAGANTEIFVINNLTQDGISRSVEEFSAKLKESLTVRVSL